MTSIHTRAKPHVATVAALALGVALGVALVLAPPAHASTRNYLTVEGRVVDHLGNPLAETWVYCLGSRRASVEADSLGRYRLEIPGATLEELEHSPLKIRVQARRNGFRFALASGAPELGLEMRVVKDDSPLARLRVRSNDSTTVSAVANSVVLDANPRALLTAQFVGSRGAQYDSPPVPLDESDEITLAGDSNSIPELTPPPPAAPAKPPSKPASTTGPAPAMTTAAPSPPGVPAPAVESAPSKTPPPAAPAKSGKSDKSKASSSEPHKWNAGGSDKDAAKPRTVRPGNPAATTTATPGGASAPPAEAHGGSTAAPTAPHGGSKAAPAASHGDGTAPGGEVSSNSDPNLKPVYLRDVPAEKVAPGSPKPAQSVPMAPGTAPRPTAGDALNVPMCDCTIRGTVEVQWDRPLTSRTEVVISIEDTPDVIATAELFMGSPRSFEIHPAPCGVHRLRLWTRSKQRFVLVSSEPRVVCSPGGVQQMRLVLEPVARWGASQ